MKVLVTPDMAAEWLAHNTHNRRLDDRLVQDYARDMAAGNWHYNGETIKVSVDGVLLDGQHRAAAVVAAGLAVTMEVIMDLPANVQDTMDIGRKRSVGDQLSLSGENYAHNLAAITRRAWQWDQKNHRFSASPSPTPSEVRATIEKYPSLRRSAEMGHRLGMNFRPVKASVAGIAHHLFLQIDPDDTAQFFAWLETGADMPEGHPVLALRNRLTQDKIQQRAIPFHVHVGCCIRVWNAFRKNESLTIVKMTGDSAMPMPL